jgi:hypothetical protein
MQRRRPLPALQTEVGATVINTIKNLNTRPINTQLNT